MPVGHMLRHDAAWAAAQVLTEIVAPALRPEEHRECVSEFYRVVLAALEAYEQQSQREALRLKPSKN